MKKFCLTLPESPDATAKAIVHFEERGVDNVEFVWGLHADVAGLATSHVYERDAPGSGFKMGSKPTGIWLAHWLVWQIAMRTNEEHVMVLENDAMFDVDWKEKFEDALKHVPTNYDFLHIGHCCMEGFPRKHVGGMVYESKHAQCTHAYIIRRAVIPFMLKTLRKCYGPIDIQMQLECFPHLNTYAVMPRIVSQFNTVIPP